VLNIRSKNSLISTDPGRCRRDGKKLVAVSDPATRFTNRADNYARYRWDFSPQAIEAIFRITGLSPAATAADVGSGTGMLSQHFVERVSRLFALEPNKEMRKLGLDLLESYPSYTSIDGYAEATTLPENSVDLIVVGRAIHWFDAKKARAEFLRILKPKGWLAILQTPCKDQELDEAIKQIRKNENGWDVDGDKAKLIKTPLSFYFGGDDFITLIFPEIISETWQEFFGRQCSVSSAPVETHPLYPNFKKAAQEIFQKFSVNGCLSVEIATELHVGQVLPD